LAEDSNTRYYSRINCSECFRASFTAPIAGEYNGGPTVARGATHATASRKGLNTNSPELNTLPTQATRNV
jgi:hypothetical protein